MKTNEQIIKLREKAKRCDHAINIWPEQLKQIQSAGLIKSMRDFSDKNKIDHTLMSRMVGGKRAPTEDMFKKVNTAIARYIKQMHEESV